MVTSLAVEASGLVKTFGRTRAVDGVDLAVPEGSIFGFLGPNGAGKSTTISILCTLTTPTAGTARVAGFDVVDARDDVRRRIGLVFQDPTLDQDLTAGQNLRFHAQLYRVPQAATAARIAEVLDLVGLSGRSHQAVQGAVRWTSPETRDRPRTVTYAVTTMRHTIFGQLDLSSAARDTLDPALTWFGWHVPSAVAAVMVGVLGLGPLRLAMAELREA